MQTQHNQLPAPNQSELAPESIGAELGNVAMSEVAIEPTSSIIIGGVECQTDLPEGLEVFDTSNDMSTGLLATTPESAVLDPNALDAIPQGVFTVSGTYRKHDANFTMTDRTITRTIEARPSQAGTVITVESFGRHPNWRIQPDSVRLMTALGYEVEGEDRAAQITAVPTPQTVKAAAHELGVDIKLFPNTNVIDGVPYLQSYVDGQYPVSVGDFYQHDVEDDHLTAVVLGGEPLKAALKKTSEQALVSGREAIDTTANTIDKLTATLRAVVSSHSELAGEEYGQEKGRATFVNIADRLGISSDEANDILAHAQASGQHFGLDVKTLN